MAERTDKATLARATPAGFAWLASGESWIPADHLLLLSRAIARVCVRGGRLMVFMPPRHGKSELISKYTPAWYLGNFPDNKVMLTSYADTFAASWGRRARDVYDAMAPRLWGTRVNPETAGGQFWEVDGHEGVMVTAGVGGGLTGKGANLLIIDDPIKNSEEAQSEVLRDKHHDWWKSTARTRLQKDAAVIFVMTRWHEDDLAGRLIKDMMEADGDQWEILALPGISEGESTATYPDSQVLRLGEDPLGRPEGAALWPAMFDVEDLERTRRAMGTYWFNGMYQQRPSSAEGNLFKRANFRYFQYDDVAKIATLIHDDRREIFDPEYGLKFQTIDTATDEKQSADYTVISTWIVTVNRDLLLWDRARAQLEGPEVKTLIRREWFRHQPSLIGIEKEKASRTIIQELVREGLPIVPLTPDKDKVSRALPAAARYEEHRVFHPEPIGDKKWVSEEWEPELLNFPNAAHDDQVDTVAYAAMQLPLLQPGGAMRGVAGPAATRQTLMGGLLTRQL